MTKKDYELIATVVRQFNGDTQEKLAWMFAGQLQLTNPRFDQDKFLTACGIQTEPIEGASAGGIQSQEVYLAERKKEFDDYGFKS